MSKSKPKFTETDICQSGNYCMACRFSNNMRESWFKQYAVPDDIRERCARGKTDEEIKKAHEERIKEMQESKKEPSAAKKVASFGKAVAKRAGAAAKGKRINTPPEILEERKAICEENKCGKFVRRKGRQPKCRACGCQWEKKLSWATEECPLGFWFRVDERLEEKDE